VGVDENFGHRDPLVGQELRCGFFDVRDSSSLPSTVATRRSSLLGLRGPDGTTGPHSRLVYTTVLRI